ncbi:nucleotide exchange factor GrpE [Chelatococcus asaccharovorans]|uniref:Protein GrpE n=1 Tax=Chelatococcus asaccharovorans TaxID=28210 RepID=A0A2V3TT36_9HYPH|nr:nucleotide exchange factor GrpE [Chelatococcus asaccharovorans]MBS7704881.1 nucleotide exchange factor GrpE [Chelatococcus asaccharovorans]PXW51344.1 molecular chaperone GrpE [Chelatococcus asaccharovorans]
MTQTPPRPEPVDADKDANAVERDETLAGHVQDEIAAEAAAIAALEAEKRELKDKLLRTLAEMENLRRRTEREIADARAYGITSFARDMLTAADNIRRAIETIPEDVRAQPDNPVKPFLEGIELTERDVLKTLERHGVRKIDPIDQKFDPNLHQAMFEVEDLSKPHGTVVQVIQSGFVISDRVLRPALVGVSKGGPKVPTGNGTDTDPTTGQ